ncbi:hypothetical protein O181_118899 [Austropuccinia psidii MF-1]|uniref:Uncharacterized protein n=1 Tax=Austropuccinia psidii MF-1 TaxID=1389203 RepID=A0A9Q3PYX3_9BASI|nr:hypothetical protein [Austropuccinia psidii MF-1]
MIWVIRKWWIHSGAQVMANNDWTRSLPVSHMLSYAPQDGSYAGNFHTPGRTFTASLPTIYLLVQVVTLTADAHPLARQTLRPISVELLQPHTH